MKKNVKSLLPLVLATTMVTSSVSVPVAAEETNVSVESTDISTSSSAVEVVSFTNTNSAIEPYANEDVVIGDFNCDGVFDESDLTAIQTWLADSSNTDTSTITTNHDYIVTALNVCEYNVTDLTSSQVSSAYNWLTAKLHNGRMLPCEEGDVYRWGDTDGDGKVTYADVTFLFNTILQTGSLSEEEFNAMDLNGDGSLLAQDAAILSQYLLTGYDVSPLFYITPSNYKTEYDYGETLEDVTIIRTYEDGSTLTNTVSELGATVTVDGGDATTPLDIGEHTVVIVYSEAYGNYTLTKSTTFTVNVEKKVSRLTVEEKDEKTYIEGNDFDRSNYTVTAFYNNGDTAVITDYTTDKDSEAMELGDTTVTFSYEGVSTTVDVTVIAKSLTGISITSEPNKTDYIEGNTFDATGMVVVAEYDNGDVEEITDYTVTPSTLSLSDTLVTIEYDGFTTEQPITVVEKSLTGISITSEPDKTDYIEGNTFDPTGLEITAEYDNGDTEVITDYTISPSTLALGDTEVTIEYDGFTIEQPVTVVAKSLTGIVITTEPTKTSYIEGNTFDSTGMVVTAEYDNGDTEVITDYTVTPGTLALGDTEVTIEYDGFTAEQSITVVEKSATGIKVTTEPTQTSYIEGNTFDPTGMVVVIEYDNGDTEEVTDYTVSPSILAIGDTLVTVSYDNFTTELPVTVVAKSLAGITLTVEPDKTDYIEGNIFDPTGMEIIAEYDNGDTEVITDYIVPTDPLTTEDTVVEVTYGDFIAEIPITVVAKSLTGITITAEPTKTDYIEGNTFDSTGMEVTAEYDNGDTEVVTDYTVTPDTLTLSDTLVTITYNNFTAEQPISVVEKSVTGVSITVEPDQTDYIEGNTFDPTGMEVVIEYDNGDTEVITDYTVPTDKLTTEDTTIEVSYGDFTAEIPITVVAKSLTGIAITVEPTKTDYIEGNTFDTTGMEVVAEYDNGDVEVINDYTVSPDTLSITDTLVTISYNDFTAEQPVTVVEKSATNISITVDPDKTDYIEGNTFDPTGMEVTIEYDNGDTEVITDYIISPETLTIDDTTVEVSFGDLVIEVPVTVAEKSVIGITITAEPEKTTYIEGTAFDNTGMEVTAEYDNGDIEIITDYTVTPDTLSLTDTLVTVTYDNATAQQEVTVVAKTLTGIAVTSEPDKVNYTEGDVFSIKGLVITGEYDNGETEEITDYTVPTDTLKVGQTSVQISYGDFVIEQPITVSKKSSSSSGGGSGSGSSSKKATSTSSDSDNTSSDGNTSSDSDDGDSSSVNDDNEYSYSDDSDYSTTSDSDSDMFTDISSNYAKDYINDLAQKGIISGYSDNTYRPSASTKRGDFAIVISNLLNYTGTASLNFSDVPSMSYYAQAIALATKNNSMIGFGDGTFKPEKTLSREEMFVIIAKISGANVANANTSVLNNFTDGSRVADWAKPYAAALVEAGIVNGDNGSLRPKDNITRAEMAVLISQIAN